MYTIWNIYTDSDQKSEAEESILALSNDKTGEMC